MILKSALFSPAKHLGETFSEAYCAINPVRGFYDFRR